MFDEVSGYTRAKYLEYEQKKLPVSDALIAKTETERNQLAAKYAAIIGSRSGLTAEDTYYLGLLHWISENLDAATETFVKYLAFNEENDERSQRVRSLLAVTYAKLKNLAEAEAFLDKYESSEPKKLTETSRMNVELAKAYVAKGDNEKASPFAERAYKASKALIADPTARLRGLDEMLDAGMLFFETYRDRSMDKEADAVLEDMRTVGADIGAGDLYYYATDKLIFNQLETGRKPQALATYQAALLHAEKAFKGKGSQNYALSKLKDREKHYKLIGQPAIELTGISKWFPGEERTLASMRGKVILLDFWATWCTPCFDAFPHLTEWQQDFEKDGFVVLGVTRYYGRAEGFSVDRPNEIAFLERFREKYRLPYDFVVMDGQQTQRQYGATALPTAALIDRKGIVRYIESGTSQSRIADMRAMVMKLIAEK